VISRKLNLNIRLLLLYIYKAYAFKGFYFMISGVNYKAGEKDFKFVNLVAVMNTYHRRYIHVSSSNVNIKEES